MTGLHDKRKAVESPLVRRPARSKPEAARRTKRAAEVPARRIKRTREPAPTRRRRPPPVAGDSTTISYVLRNRQVVVPCTGSPTVSRYEETTPPPVSPVPPLLTLALAASVVVGEEPEYAPARQTPTCAQLGLEHYNSVNQGDEHELVKAVESNAFTFNGIWIHANFLAKPIGATSFDDLAPKYFFSELKCDHEGLSCISCVKMDPGVPKKLGGCGVCPRQIMHPADGGYRNAQPFNDSATAKSCAFSF